VSLFDEDGPGVTADRIRTANPQREKGRPSLFLDFPGRKKIRENEGDRQHDTKKHVAYLFTSSFNPLRRLQSDRTGYRILPKAVNPIQPLHPVAAAKALYSI